MVVAGFAAAPALAASAEATGTGTAISGSVGPMTIAPLTYTATNDGSGEQVSGMKNPAIPLPAFGSSNAGVAYQDATTTAKDGKLTSAACAGISGAGGTVVAAGNGSCLEGGGQISLDAGSLDLSGAALPSDADILKILTTAGLPKLPTLPTPTTSASSPVVPSTGSETADGATPAADLPVDPLQPVIDQITTALQSGLTGLGSPSLSLKTDAIQSFCTAEIGDAKGKSTLSDVRLVASVNGTDTTLLTIPSSGSPANTNVSGAAGFSTLVTDALNKSLTDSLGGAAGPLAAAGITNAIQEQIVGATTKPLDDAFGMLFSATANKQVVSTDKNSIEVTALSLALLPAAKGTPLGTDAADLDLGKSTCSAGSFQVDAPTASPTPTVAPTVAPVVPTSVDSGLSGDQGSSPFLPIVGGLMLLGGAGIGVRRFLSTRG